MLKRKYIKEISKNCINKENGSSNTSFNICDEFKFKNNKSLNKDAVMNYYIGGSDGKDVFSRSISRNIHIDMLDEDIFFNIDKDNMFLGYDNQPVLIWSDFSPVDLVDKIGVDNVNKMFNRDKLEFDSVSISNKINIINNRKDGISYMNDLNRLVSNKDISLTFDMFLQIKNEMLDISINKGVLDYEVSSDYIYYSSLNFKIRELVKLFGVNGAKSRELQSYMSYPIVCLHNDLMEKVSFKKQRDICRKTL
ncbi:MAG: hypothetical protein R3Y64_08275 [Peptostreptococcaceae bacterium]